MLQAHQQFKRQYQEVGIRSRVEGANPHQLVQILFDELIVALDLGERSIKSGDHAKKSAQLSRALSILHALESSLDHDAGGSIAEGLGTIYRHARREIVSAIVRSKPEHVRAAAEPLTEIATAWRQIG